MDSDLFHCEVCESEVSNEAEYCPNCGSVFNEELKCINHKEFAADGVCVICGKPFCERCGDMVKDLFLCYDHEHYEVIQNYARVKGGSIEIELQFYKDCLEKEGLHPLLFNRKASPLHMGSGDYTLFRASGEYDGHFVNEIKLMVPCSEVLEAEKILAEVDEGEQSFDPEDGSSELID